MTNLIQHSLKVIRENQQASGAFPACPTMPDYQFCWFRDGSFIAHAMLLYGEVDSAKCFHEWSARTILRYRQGAKRAMEDFRAGRIPDKRDVLCARYTYNSEKGPVDWPEFQLDGLGTWLWASTEFAGKGHELTSDIREAYQFVADYLAVLWPSPCHDLWEEHGDQVHTYTLAAIYAGLQAAAMRHPQANYGETAADILAFMLQNCAQAVHGFVKSVGVDLVDGSLVGVAVPYLVTNINADLVKLTIKRIEDDLYKPGIGVHRYLSDSYYAGGAWLLLVAWLGWYYVEAGLQEKGEAILAAIEKFSTPEGDLPEQIVPPQLAEQSFYDDWVRWRGTIATPLLWSHAMYLILAHSCGSILK
jgi:GH15 family glucan-1,4-alpha-glucosidase